jgi:hypothetical protein
MNGILINDLSAYLILFGDLIYTRYYPYLLVRDKTFRIRRFRIILIFNNTYMGYMVIGVEGLR